MYLFSAVIPGETGKFTDSTLHEGFTAISDRQTDAMKHWKSGVKKRPGE